MPPRLSPTLLALILLAATPLAYAAITITALPEPGTVLLMGLGLAAIGIFHKQGRRLGKFIQRWVRARLQR